MTLLKVKKVLKEHKHILRERYGVKGIGVFGSYVKGKQRPKSDLDVLVDFEKPISLLRFIEMENYLSGLVGVKVDLVMKDSLKPRIGSNILKEVVNV